MTKINIMMNGLPGNVAAAIARIAARDERFNLIDASLTGPDITDTHLQVEHLSVRLIRPEAREAEIAKLKETYGTFFTIDFTHPTAVNDNAEFYCKNALPFVMGTTGGDRDKLHATVTGSDNAALIAPNMAKQIVGYQAILEYAAETFPGLFEGYNLTIRESHQQGKADTSGTAKAMVDYFNRLGIPFTEGEIIKERDPEAQRSQWQIPEEHIAGHAWHTYTLDAPDGNARFGFTHNINGRDIYAEGTLDGVIYLKEKIEGGAKGAVFTMIDLLKGV